MLVAILLTADGCQSEVAVHERPITEASDEPRMTPGVGRVKGRLPEICGKKPKGTKVVNKE
jgi:hypothetical protein